MKQERTDKMRLDHIATLLEEVRILQESVLSTVVRVTEKLSSTENAISQARHETEEQRTQG